MRRHVEVDDVASGVVQDDEYEEDAKGEGRDGEEVDPHQATGVVLKEAAPALRGALDVMDLTAKK